MNAALMLLLFKGGITVVTVSHFAEGKLEIYPRASGTYTGVCYVDGMVTLSPRAGGIVQIG